MFSFKSFVFAALLSSCEASVRARKLSNELIAGFEPRTVVTDHNAIDLDQAKIEDLLATPSTDTFSSARDVYEQGSHSKSFAVLTLDPALTVAVPEGTVISGKNEDGSTVSGTALKSYSVGDTTIEIQYSTGNTQATYVDCQVGGNPDPNTSGCFAANGTVTISGSSGSLPYSYDPLVNNDNGRTIQGFSTAADTRFRPSGGGELFPDFQKFFDYYGTLTYADEWVQSAFARRSTSFSNGDADFSKYGDDGILQAVKKGTAYISIAMYVIRELEDALDDCDRGCDTADCNDDAVHALDEAVAFWTGSLEGKDGSGSGVLMYGLADTRCANFKTCGRNNNEDNGKSKVNFEVFRLFDMMQKELTEKKCDAARATKEKIVPWMTVPLIQGVLRYAYIIDKDGFTEKAEAEGATFAAAVLPYVASCNAADAETIYDHMRVGRNGGASYSAVFDAFVRQSSCMGISCSDIGGYWNKAQGTYEDGAAPCGGSGSSDDGANVGLAVGLSIGGLLVLVLLGVVLRRRRSASGSTVEFKDTGSTPI